MKKIIFFTAIFMAMHGFSQQTINGLVKSYINKKQSKPLYGAEVFLLSSRSGDITNNKGVFQIKGDINLPDTLVFRANGYYSDSLVLKQEDLNKSFEIILYPEYVTEEVVILGKRDDSNILKLSPRNVESLNSGELRKAACCNLSESFETNATVDVSLSDGVSGSKRIQMMGLNGRFTQLQFENIPFMNNLDQAFGLGSVPGTWIESIQITKGTGTVTNGYESMAGLINLEYRKPDNIEKLYFNLYGNIQGRTDINLHGGKQISDKWSSAWFIHYNSQFLENDRNDDGFRDMPIGDHVVAMNRWKYKAPLFRAQFGIKAYYADRMGGQVGYDRYSSNQGLYGVGIRNLGAEAFGKTGFLFKKHEFSSIGVVYYAKYSEINTMFGNRSLMANERRGYTNFMYETILGNTNHKLKTGASFVFDDLQQIMSDVLPTDTSTRELNRTELVPGVFGEYTFSGVLSTIVLGWRSDYHNLFGLQHSPRANYRYRINENMDFRVTGGRGFRVSNYAIDNLSLMATNTPWRINEQIDPEVSWNFGASYFWEFKLFNRKATWSVDFYHTFFENQLIADRDESTEYILMKNLDGESFSNAFQTDVKIEPTIGLEIKAAYKYLDVRATMGGRLMERLMVPRHRGFLNVGYKARNKRWEYDATISVFGTRRLASVELPNGNISEDNRAQIVPLLSGQITHNFRKFEVYVGGENLLDFRLENPIVNVENPFNKTFDATRVYAPIFGINVYGGIRIAIKNKNED